MKNSYIRKEFMSTIVIFIFLFFMTVPIALAVTQTRYYRSDQQTVNGLTAYILGTTQTGTNTYIEFIQGPPCGPSNPGSPWYKSDVIKRASGGSETVLGSGVAATSRTVFPPYGEGLQSATWSCPQTAMSRTDAVKIVEYIQDPSGTTRISANLITEQLNASQLDAATWTFYKYTYFSVSQCFPSPPRFTWRDATYWGSSSYNTRIENVSIVTDCGLRTYNGTAIITIACDPAGFLTSPLRISNGSTTYGIVLVQPSHPKSSNIRINTSSGVMSLRKL